MSEVETHYGKLRKIDISNYANVEDYAKSILSEKGLNELPSYHDTWVRYLIDEFENKIVVVGSSVWEVFDHLELNEQDVDLTVVNPDGTITFFFQFYNGGTCLNEMLEDGIKRKMPN